MRRQTDRRRGLLAGYKRLITDDLPQGQRIGTLRIEKAFRS